MTNTKVLKRNVINLTRFQLSYIYIQLLIFILTVVLNFVIGLIVSAISKDADGGGSLDVVAIIYGLVCGVLFFSVSFKFSLVNGVSRNTLFISCILTFFVCATVLTVVTGVLMCIFNAGNTLNIYFLIYGKRYGALFLWLFVATLFAEAIGWFISVFFYRASKKIKLIALGVGLAIVPLFFLFNLIDNGALSRALIKAVQLLFGISKTTVSPFLSILSFFVITLGLVGGTFLMLKRAVIKS